MAQMGSGIAGAVAEVSAVALIQSLAWELPHAAGVALKRKKKKKKREKSYHGEFPPWHSRLRIRLQWLVAAEVWVQSLALCSGLEDLA